MKSLAREGDNEVSVDPLTWLSTESVLMRSA